tara:strand:+ start:291 stop:449 length:159 start_codon:yes stop_codon:yes gene_type:complete
MAVEEASANVIEQRCGGEGEVNAEISRPRIRVGISEQTEAFVVETRDRSAGI